MNGDFRSYLKTVDPHALAYTGNDGRIDPTKAGYDTNEASYLNQGDNQKKVQQYISGIYDDFLGGQPRDKISSIYGGNGGISPVYAPKLDVASLNAKARAQAESAVNPYYVKALNDFLAQQAAAKARTEQQYKTDVANIDTTLQNTLQENAINRERTAQDVSTNIADINNQTEQFQTDSGQQFEKDRLAQARQQAASGTLGTGAGNRQTAETNANRNTQEFRQEVKFQEARAQQQLFKGRTFADLTRADKQASQATDNKKKQAKFDLDTYMENQNFAEKNKRNELEQSRLSAVADESRNQSRLLYNQYLSGITDPAKYVAAVNTYGGVV